jgi:hypothetical protein
MVDAFGRNGPAVGSGLARSEWHRLSRSLASKLAKWTLAGLTELAGSVLPGAMIVPLDGYVLASASAPGEVPACDMHARGAAVLVEETEAWLRSQ